MNGFNFTTDGIKGVRKALDAKLADLGGAKSPEMKAMGNAVAKSWRRVLSVSGGARVARSIKSRKLVAHGGTPSAPGQPPRKQTGQTAKSVKVGVVGAGLRVGVLRFTAPILEEGVNTANPPRKNRKGRIRTRARKGVLVIAPRPSADKAIEGAKDAMIDGFTAAFDKRLGT